MDRIWDLIVCGGGFTGVAAAVAAAREGAQVLLIEKNGYLGGAAAQNYVNPFMGYQMTDRESGRQVQLNCGLFDTILHRLDELGGLHKNRVTFNEEMVKLVFDRLTREHGVRVLFHSFVEAAEVEAASIRCVRAVSKGGQHTYRARYFIDATGDADLTVLSGCSYRLGREPDNACQPMTLCFRIAGVDTDAYWNGGREEANRLYKQRLSEGRLLNPREDVLTFRHMADGVVHFNSTRVIRHCPVNTEELSEAESLAREQMYELFMLLKENVACFRNAVLLASAPEIGVRESRMLVGRYVIEAEELLRCTKFADSIARGNYEVDIHSPDGSGTTHRRVPEGDYYTIPYRALLPKEIDNLVVAGRCISSTHEAQSAYRILPICTCIGEAAGLAISLALHRQIRPADVDIAALHALLDKYGAAY